MGGWGRLLAEGKGFRVCDVAVVRGHLLDSAWGGRNRMEAVSGDRPLAGPV